MNKPPLLALLVTSAFLAGCADSGVDGDRDEGAIPQTQYQSSVLNLSVPVMPREPPAAGERTLEQVPEWRLGEWWTYTMTDGFTGSSYEFTRVVAGEDRAAGNYLVGFPVDAFSNDIMLFHIPGYGDIVQDNLAYETHDAYFQPLSFPLTDGKTWNVSFEGVANGLAEASVDSATKATITMSVSVYGSILATYDAEVGEITEMTIGQDGSYAHYEVTGHGYDYQGTVRVPHAHDLVFNNGRFAGAVVVGNSQPVAGPAGGVTEQVIVEPGYDRVSFIIAVGGGPALTGLPAAAGVFRETVTAPDATVYEETWTPADAPNGQLKIVAIGHDKPEGTWSLQHVAGGVGVAFVEGIGYHSIDIELPSGCVVASFNAQHHNADCKVQGNTMVAGNATTV
ncbi:MAG: hypothetical protein AABY18_04845 [Candidatus Thermoplasmatota archaeon]|mgnify:CR=1 FL=1